MILFFTDLHINETAQFSAMTDNGFTVRQKEAIQACQDVVNLLRDPQYHFTAVVFGGDWFNPVGNQISITNMATATKCMTMIQNECIRLGIMFYVLTGNHDSSSRENASGFHKLAPFKHYQNIKIVENLEIVDNMVFLPYMYDDSAANAFLEQIEDKENKIAFSHLEIKDYELINGMKTTRGASFDMLKQFKQVLQGHYHTPSTPAPNIIVAGSTQKTSFKDPGGGTIVLYDEDTGSTKRVPFTVSSWYTFDDDDIEELKKLSFDNYVKITISSESILKFAGITKEYLSNFKGVEKVIDVQKISGKKIKRDEELQKRETEEEVLSRFIELANVPLEDKQTLTEVGLELIARARK